jgi:hypothetical protein
MTSESNAGPDTPLNTLLAELTDAKLEKREADIERLQQEIAKRQAQGEQPEPTPEAEVARKEF